MGASGNPETALAIFHALILARQIHALASGTALGTTLRQVASTSAEFRAYGCVLGDPVGEGVLTVLNDAVSTLASNSNTPISTDDCVRFAGFISIICFASLARRYWSIVDEFQEMLSETSNDSKLLAMLTKSIKLVGESCL